MHPAHKSFRGCGLGLWSEGTSGKTIFRIGDGARDLLPTGPLLLSAHPIIPRSSAIHDSVHEMR